MVFKMSNNMPKRERYFMYGGIGLLFSQLILGVGGILTVSQMAFFGILGLISMIYALVCAHFCKLEGNNQNE